MADVKILVADDNQQIRLLVSAALRILGYELLMAVDGEEALQVATEEVPDLVLLDVQMPQLDGFEVLSFLRKRPETSGIKVVMLTTAAQVADKKRGAELGAIDYVVKPFEPKVLREVVERALTY